MKYKKCFGYMDYMSKRVIYSSNEDIENKIKQKFELDIEGESKKFEFPAALKKDSAKESLENDAVMVIEPEYAIQCMGCEYFERCASFTEMSRKYSANQVNKLAKKVYEMLENKKDSLIFRLFK
jgi:hypothetical protein